jgi:hypothetical protein
MKFAAATALLATSVAAGAAELFATDSTTLAFDYCNGCDCGEMVCEAKQSACIFDHLAHGGDSLSKKEAFGDLADAIHAKMHVPRGPKLDAIADKYTEEIFGDKVSIDAKEFRGVYDAFREEQLGCKADGEWARAEELFSTTSATDLAFGCGGCDCGEMECETKQSACIFNYFTGGKPELDATMGYAALQEAIHSQMGMPEGPKLDAVAHHYTAEIMQGRDHIDQQEFRPVYDAFRVKQLGCKADGEYTRVVHIHSYNNYHHTTHVRYVSASHQYHWTHNQYCVQVGNVPNHYWDNGILQWAKIHRAPQTAGTGSCYNAGYRQRNNYTTTYKKVDGHTLDITVWRD